MLTVENGACELYYDADGDGEPVVFVSEAGLGGWAWGWQHAAVAGPYEAVVWDLRGTGRSDCPPGPYDLETRASDLESVLAEIGARNAHVVGAGLGGAVALEAARTSSRVRTLTLFGTGARGDEFDLERLYAPPEDRKALRESLEATFSEAFREEQPDVLEGIVDWRADGDAAPESWEAQVAALEDFDATDWGYEVTQPTLLVHGTDDDCVPLESARELEANLPRGDLETVEGAGHLAFVERSREVNDHLMGFLEEHGLED